MGDDLSVAAITRDRVVEALDMHDLIAAQEQSRLAAPPVAPHAPSKIDWRPFIAAFHRLAPKTWRARTLILGGDLLLRLVGNEMTLEGTLRDERDGSVFTGVATESWWFLNEWKAEEIVAAVIDEMFEQRGIEAMKKAKESEAKEYLKSREAPVSDNPCNAGLKRAITPTAVGMPGARPSVLPEHYPFKAGDRVRYRDGRLTGEIAKLDSNQMAHVQWDHCPPETHCVYFQHELRPFEAENEATPQPSPTSPNPAFRVGDDVEFEFDLQEMAGAIINLYTNCLGPCAEIKTSRGDRYRVQVKNLRHRAKPDARCNEVKAVVKRQGQAAPKIFLAQSDRVEWDAPEGLMRGEVRWVNGDTVRVLLDDATASDVDVNALRKIETDQKPAFKVGDEVEWNEGYGLCFSTIGEVNQVNAMMTGNCWNGYQVSLSKLRHRNAHPAEPIAVGPLEYRPLAGQSIAGAAESLVGLANSGGAAYFMTFNDVRLEAMPFTTVDDVVKSYDAAIGARANSVEPKPKAGDIVTSKMVNGRSVIERPRLEPGQKLALVGYNGSALEYVITGG